LTHAAIARSTAIVASLWPVEELKRYKISPVSRPTHLRVEHLDDPLGIDVRQPRLSWRLPAGAREQLAYYLRAGEWETGRVESSSSVLVPYEGPELRSGQRIEWSVKVSTDLGESDWAEPSWWEMGLLAPQDWLARWIEPRETDEVRSQVVHPAYLLRTSFAVAAPVARARLYATAHGIYELFINGRRVGDMELTPGYTSYWSNLQVQAFDVAELLEPGDNVIDAVLSDGWFRGQTCSFRLPRVYGDSVALLAQLHVDDADGSRVCAATGAGWQAATGCIRAADLMEGQIVDLRSEPDGWAPVAVRDFDLTRLRSSPAPPVRRVEEVPAIAVTQPGADRQVVDLGQNINGWVRLSNLGPAGTAITLTHGEALDAAGDVTLENINADVEKVAEIGAWPWDASNWGSPFQTDRVTSAGVAGDVFEPRHTTHGFRYVRVEGHPGELSPGDVTGIVVHSDLRETGSFTCSDERINRLHDAAVWSFRGNACDIPTDCPTRERAGWTGDWQIFVEAAAFLYDVAGFSTKWLRDVAAEQQPDGAVLHVAPSWPMDVPNNPIPAGSAGWGDAAVIVPWEIYRAYGDRRLLEEQWSSMVAWVEYAARAAREHRHPSRIASRPAAALHEEYIWDTGFHFGEWLEPGEFEFDFAKIAAADHGDLATAYLHHSACLLTEIARVLERHEDELRYRELAAATKEAWQIEFIRPDGALSAETQATYARALAFDLVPADLRPSVASRLVELIRDAGTHLGTGFLTTPYLLPVLAKSDHLGVAYELLFQDTEPSWLTMIDRGATTIWEGWDGVDENGVARYSLNHYSKGAVISFLHRYLAGIQLLDGEPAYKRFRIAPQPGGGITSARATHESPYGRIESSWHITEGDFVLEVAVPAGTTAEVRLPDGQHLDASPGLSTYRTSGRRGR
jgi:alpha-L-rhamnosidase